MALSYYSNWADSFLHHDSTVNIADDPELQALLHGAAVDGADCFFNPDDFFCFDQNSNNNNNDNNSLLYDDVFTNAVPPFDVPFFPEQEIELKRRKCCDSDQDFYSAFLAPNPCLAVPEYYTPSPFLAFPAEGYSNGSCDWGSERRETSAAPSTVSLSTQSVAARQRRRRITEKTQELGKLVPGGQKMNTAEMLQSAYKYIKFLQAQVALLEFVGLNKEVAEEAPFEGEDLLQSLLESPLIQEKLYSTENCLVPTKLVDEKTALEKHH